MAENNSSVPLKTAEGAVHPHLIALRTIAEYPATDSLMNMDAANMRRIAAQAVEAQAAPAAVAVTDAQIDAILDEPGGMIFYVSDQRQKQHLFARRVLALATPALSATEDSSAGDLASGSENAVKDFMALVDDWREKDFAAAEANDPWVENAQFGQRGLAKRLEAEADNARKAIESKLIGLLDARLLKVAAQGEASADEYPHEQMDALAIARYKVVPRNQGVHCIHAVVAGDGQQHLYNGSEVDCQNMARKFAGAFLDGAFAFHQRYIEPHAQPTDALDAETIKKAADYDHLLPYLCKTCGGYGLIDRRSNEGPMDSEPCPNCSRPPDRIDFFLDELQRDGAEMLIMALHDEEGFPLDKKRAIAALDKARVIRAAMAAAQEGGNAAKET